MTKPELEAGEVLLLAGGLPTVDPVGPDAGGVPEVDPDVLLAPGGLVEVEPELLDGGLLLSDG